MFISWNREYVHALANSGVYLIGDRIDHLWFETRY